MSFMYVIAPHKNDTDRVKLGISDDPERRRRQLQTGHSEPLHVFHTEPVPDGKARLFERLLHRDLNHRRIRGEWFNMNVADAVAHIQFTIIQYDNVDDLAGKIRDRRI